MSVWHQNDKIKKKRKHRPTLKYNKLKRSKGINSHWHGKNQPIEVLVDHKLHRAKGLIWYVKELMKDGTVDQPSLRAAAISTSRAGPGN